MINNAPIAAAITVKGVTGDVLASGASDAETEVVLPGESSTCVEYEEYPSIETVTEWVPAVSSVTTTGVVPLYTLSS